MSPLFVLNSYNSCCSSEKSFRCHKLLLFFLCIWTLSNNDCMVLRSIFSHRGQLRDSFASITEDSNTHWCSRRKNHALRAFWTFEQNEGICIFFLFCLNIIFFLFSTALQFSRRQIKSFRLHVNFDFNCIHVYTSCYVYWQTVRLSETCHLLTITLLLVLIASIVLICKSLWIKASAKCNVHLIITLKVNVTQI